MRGLRPMAKIGNPGPISPTAWYDGDLTPAMSQTLGTRMPRCGSLARTAPPVSVRPGASAKLLLPDRPTPARIRRSSAVSPAPSKLGGEARPFSSSRSQISGQSARLRNGSRSVQTSQFTSVPTRRPTVSTSATVQGSRSRPSTRNSCGGSPIRSW